MRYEKLLLTADDDPCSLKAVRCGYELAAQLGAKVALIGVVEPVVGDPDAGIFLEEANRRAKDHMEALLYRLKNDYGSGIPTEIFAPVGQVEEVVLQMAKEWGAHIIVAGTHGRKGLSRLFMGSTAEDMLRDSGIPLFIVPMDK